MLPKKQKLNGKTVNFLLRKRNVFHGRYFSFFYVRQYPQIQTSQRGFFIPKAIQKSAVKRHVLTRKLYGLIDKGGILGETYVRVFVRPNKRAEKEWLQLVANRDKKRILPVLVRWFEKDMGHFGQRIQRKSV